MKQNELMHYGVEGMRWYQHLKAKSTEKAYETQKKNQEKLCGKVITMPESE